MKVTAYTAPVGKVIGSRGLTDNVNAGHRQVQELTEYINGLLTAPNQQPGGPFQARFLTDALRGANPADGITAETLLRDRSQLFYLGCIIPVEFDGSSTRWNEYRVEYDGVPRTGAAFPGVRVYRTADMVDGELLPAKLVPLADTRDFVAYATINGNTYRWRVGQYASAYIAAQSSEQFFRYVGPNDTPAPAPTGTPADANIWVVASLTDIPPAGATTAQFNALQSRVAAVEDLVVYLQTGKVEVWQPGPVYADRVYLLLGGIGNGIYRPKNDLLSSGSVSLAYYTRLIDFRFLPTQDVELLIAALDARKADLVSGRVPAYQLPLASASDVKTGTSSQVLVTPQSLRDAGNFTFADTEVFGGYDPINNNPSLPSNPAGLVTRGTYYRLTSSTKVVSAPVLSNSQGTSDNAVYVDASFGPFIAINSIVTGANIPANTTVVGGFRSGSSLYYNLSRPVQVTAGTVLTFTPAFGGFSELVAGDLLRCNGIAWEVRPGLPRVLAVLSGAGFDLYKGNYNPVTNTPFLSPLTGTKGEYYRLSVDSPAPKTTTITQYFPNDTALRVASTAGIVAGMLVSGAGIPAGVRVSSVTSAVDVIVSQQVSPALNAALTFTFDFAGQSSITAGQYLWYSGADWRVRSFGGTTSGGGVASGIDYTTPVLHNADTTLTAADCGRHHVFTGTGQDLWTVQLPDPAAAAGKQISVRVANGASGMWAFTAADIDGEPERLMWAGEVAFLTSDGSSWHKQGGRFIPLTITLGMSGGQTLSGYQITTLNFTQRVSGNAPTRAFYAAANGIRALRKGLYAAALTAYCEASGLARPVESIVSVNGDYGHIKSVNTASNVAASGNGQYWVQLRASENPYDLEKDDYVNVRVYSDTGLVIYNQGAIHPFFSLTEIQRW